MPQSTAVATESATGTTDWRKEFFEFEDAIYLNLAGQSPIPRVAARALDRARDWKKLPHTVPEEMYFGLPNRVRALIAQLIGGKPEEVALASGASAGLQAVARGINWKPTDEVLMVRGEFPAHPATWVPMADAGRLHVRWLAPRERFITTEEIAAAVTPQTRLVSISHVRFDDGVRVNPRPIADAVHRHGGYLLLDVSQSCGAVPFNVVESSADFLVCAGYKWLLSPFGSGFFWIRQELIDRLQPGPFYWMAIDGADRFHSLTGPDVKHTPAPAQARRWDLPETASFFNLAAMEASLEFVTRVGAQAVWEHNLALIEHLIARLPVDRLVLASPREAEKRGPYACVRARQPERTAELYEKLRAEKIYVSLREGALRVSPYLYNIERDIDRLIAVLSV
jgi:selenocysteine lyase/cysteine desulfurase